MILALLPAPALAGVCDQVRPDWATGTAVSALDEALIFAATPPALVLLLATALVVRLRSQWGGLAVVVLWTLLVTFWTFVDVGGLRAAAMAEGCVGSPALFTGIIAAICVATILYTAPPRKD